MAMSLAALYATRLFSAASFLSLPVANSARLLIILQDALLAPITFLYATDSRFLSSTVSSTSMLATFFIDSTISGRHGETNGSVEPQSDAQKAFRHPRYYTNGVAGTRPGENSPNAEIHQPETPWRGDRDRSQNNGPGGGDAATPFFTFSRRLSPPMPSTPPWRREPCAAHTASRLHRQGVIRQGAAQHTGETRHAMGSGQEEHSAALIAPPADQSALRHTQRPLCARPLC
ncbi:hypothetical protein EYF80_042436 [Liparis tanakae]|uniref:Uncharacterized protein n=1 Tax=Liparis tanakae TaxID=230148 RepID=A0A4Z2G1D1_9TELE|nr:hypothetical protein EYF80_042436 [Liparis tanakae]